MKISVIGASGNVGRRVIAEALHRGHQVTAVLRNPEKAIELPGAVAVRIANVANANEVAKVCQAQDAVVNATRPPPGFEHEVVPNTNALLEGISSTPARLLVVGGAASLTVPNTGGKRVIEDPRYLAPAYRPVGFASLQQYQICREENRVDWVYLCPPAELVPGARTGVYRSGTSELLMDTNGRSHISMEDLAVAILDEIETPRHHKQRFTAAY